VYAKSITIVAGGIVCTCAPRQPVNYMQSWRLPLHAEIKFRFRYRIRGVRPHYDTALHGSGRQQDEAGAEAVEVSSPPTTGFLAG
jgi:hypothetical protein